MKTETEKSDAQAVHVKTKETLERAHGRIACVKLGGAWYYFKTPSFDQYMMYQADLDEDTPNSVAAAVRNLMSVCSVGEDAGPAIKLLPAAIPRMSRLLQNLAGSGVETEISKE